MFGCLSKINLQNSKTAFEASGCIEVSSLNRRLTEGGFTDGDVLIPSIQLPIEKVSP